VPSKRSDNGEADRANCDCYARATRCANVHTYLSRQGKYSGSSAVNRSHETEESRRV
jgi:hypothetical protein